MSEKAILFWQLVALLLQVGLLGVNAWLVKRYVDTTNKIKEATFEQAEGASKPVVVLDDVNGKLRLVNVGNGPALSGEWWLWPEENDELPWSGAPSGRFSFLGKNLHHELGCDRVSLANTGRKVIARYRSIGDHVYRTESFVRPDPMIGEWYDNRFIAEPLNRFSRSKRLGGFLASRS